MAESPVSLQRAECSNGKRKLIVREREYDVLSWHGLKTVTSVVVAIIGVTVAVLTAYYSAEASQNTRISQQSQDIATHRQRFENTEQNLYRAFQKFDDILTEQRKVLDDTKQAITRIDTRQQVLVKEVEKISDKLDKRNP